LRIAGQCPLTLTRAPRLLEVDAMTRPNRFAPARLAALMAATAVLSLPTTGVTQAARMNVEIDQATRVQLRGAAGSVIVGNPLIADVTVVDANTLYITGKGYGVTEIIAVDTIGRTVFQSEVVVSEGSGTGRVRVWRGGQPTEMACGSSCSPSVRTSGDVAPVGQ
jgi:Flp pilus assembly secretin CpaC